MMRRGFKCRKIVLEELKRQYEHVVKSIYRGNLLESLKNFDSISEKDLRPLLGKYYPNQKSLNQAWKTCKGSLYEYAAYRYIENIVKNDKKLKDMFEVVMGDDVLNYYKDQIVIRNWSDIFPDVDILLINKKRSLVTAIISCKTSLRERLTETAFWKRELEKTKTAQDLKFLFITTDKDNELGTETNRYILLYVIDYAFITNMEKYNELIKAYKKKYGERDDFSHLLAKVRFIDEIKEVFEDFIKT